jgi:hypothetical protein
MQAFIGQFPPVIVKKGMALLSLSKDAQRGACPRRVQRTWFKLLRPCCLSPRS